MLQHLLFWGLFPFTLPQAIIVHYTAPRFPAANGPTDGTIGSGKKLNLLALGDSIIAGVGAVTLSNALVGRTAYVLAKRLQHQVTWHALGAIGADSKKVLNHLIPKLPSAEADIILLSVGINDITSLSRQYTWQRNLIEILARLKQHSPNAIISILGIPPLNRFPLLPQPLRTLLGIRAATFDFATQQILTSYPFTVYVPLRFTFSPEQFAADGYHPSEESYNKLGYLMADEIIKKLKQ